VSGKVPPSRPPGGDGVVEWSPRLLSRECVQRELLLASVQAGGEVHREGKRWVRRPRGAIISLPGLGLEGLGYGLELEERERQGFGPGGGLSGSCRQGGGAINIRVGALGAGRILSACLLRWKRGEGHRCGRSFY
jgi:hypothetical protein